MGTEPLWTGYRFREVDADGWTTFWRLDPREQPFELTDWTGNAERPGHRLWARAATPAGVRARWQTSATSVTLEIRGAGGLDAIVAPVDFLIGGVLHQRCEVQAGEQRIRVELPPGPVELEIWLPQAGAVAVREVAFDGDAVPQPPAGPRWITYGSSISQCTGAYGPSETWPALVARQHQWDLVMLGFAGECHLDPIAARTIRDTPARLISLCLGINIYGGETYSGRTLPGQVEAFLSTVREGHPHTPIVVITPLPAPNLEGKPNGLGLTLDDIRACVELGARTRQDPDLQLIDGRTVLSTEEAQALYADDVHPGPEGYRLIAERLAPLLTLPL
ncbi:lysophospholipase L1-like esterase [Kribbella voronezhensis]|uniref:Lysophospholipase L1-like esterase n=1 Tax=Kribbella voronezhensis TaxID=2512212 RepID=A0A4R7TI88_9ACTN|nr:GDSL-type esterase/lipase family protein [Kribbella voronezhensis]TDU91217.1 lysophospholipase L1-like esterase [Kribbella voronezhensis]